MKVLASRGAKCEQQSSGSGERPCSGTRRVWVPGVQIEHGGGGEWVEGSCGRVEGRRVGFIL